jgi:formylmethanofuran dehydrogenase subunit E
MTDPMDAFAVNLPQSCDECRGFLGTVPIPVNGKGLCKSCAQKAIGDQQVQCYACGEMFPHADVIYWDGQGVLCEECDDDGQGVFYPDEPEKI